MLPKLIKLLNYLHNYGASYIYLKDLFGNDLDYLLDKYFHSLNEFVNGIDKNGFHYKYCEDYSDKLLYTEEFENDEPRFFTKQEARLWQFKYLSFVEEISKLIGLKATPIKLEHKTDGYYLGTLNLDKKYAIFFCYTISDFKISSLDYIADDVEPILIHTRFGSLDYDLQKYLTNKKGVNCNICDLFSLSATKGLQATDIKKLLQFRGTRQNEVFNLADLKHNIKNPSWSDLTISIIDRDKINIRIGNYSKTFKYQDVPYFYNSRLKEAKACWFTLADFEKESLLYTPDLKNRIAELRKFFALFNIKDKPFVIEQDCDFEGKKLRRTKKSYARILLKVKLELGDYRPYT